MWDGGSGGERVTASILSTTRNGNTVRPHKAMTFHGDAGAGELPLVATPSAQIFTARVSR